MESKLYTKLNLIKFKENYGKKISKCDIDYVILKRKKTDEKKYF